MWAEKRNKWTKHKWRCSSWDMRPLSKMNSLNQWKFPFHAKPTFKINLENSSTIYHHQHHELPRQIEQFGWFSLIHAQLKQHSVMHIRYSHAVQCFERQQLMYLVGQNVMDSAKNFLNCSNYINCNLLLYSLCLSNRAPFSLYMCL